MKKIGKIVAVIAVVFVVIGVVGFLAIKNMPLPEIAIQNIDITQVKDGIYEGDYESGMVRAAVRVEVKDKKITSINILEHKNKMGEKAETLLDLITEKQTLSVDTVSGATQSSRVILKAIEVALTKGKN